MDSATIKSAAPAAVVVLAGGIGSRMQAGSDDPTNNPLGKPAGSPTAAPTNKVYLAVGGREVLAYSLEAIDASDAVGLVVLVVRDGDQDHAADLLGRVVTRHPTRITVGGASRHESERAGIEAVADDVAAGEVGVIAVHDGARPFLTTALLDEVLGAAAETGGAMAVLPVADMLYHCDEQRFVEPEGYAWAQTPQAFDGAVLLGAHRLAEEAGEEGVDTAQVVERFGDQAVVAVTGSAANIKLTFRGDLAEADALVAARTAPSAPPEVSPAQGAPDRSAAPEGGRTAWQVPEDHLAICTVAPADGVDGTTVWLHAAPLVAELEVLPDAVAAVAFVDAPAIPDAVATVFDRPGIDGVASYRPPSSALKRTEDGRIAGAVDRSVMRGLCAPELLDRHALTAALRSVSGSAVVNPASLVAKNGNVVALASGGEAGSAADLHTIVNR